MRPKADQEQLTEYESPGAMFHSHYGKIGYREWCEKERDRINKDLRRRVFVHVNPSGKVCLWESLVNGQPRWRGL